MSWLANSCRRQSLKVPRLGLGPQLLTHTWKQVANKDVIAEISCAQTSLPFVKSCFGPFEILKNISKAAPDSFTVFSSGGNRMSRQIKLFHKSLLLVYQPSLASAASRPSRSNPWFLHWTLRFGSYTFFLHELLFIYRRAILTAECVFFGARCFRLCKISVVQGAQKCLAG